MQILFSILLIILFNSVVWAFPRYGEVIKVLPERIDIFYKGSILYYEKDGTYYQPTSGGYITVPFSYDIKLNSKEIGTDVPNKFKHVHYKKVDYYVYKNNWFIHSDYGMIGVDNPW